MGDFESVVGRPRGSSILYYVVILFQHVLFLGVQTPSMHYVRLPSVIVDMPWICDMPFPDSSSFGSDL